MEIQHHLLRGVDIEVLFALCHLAVLRSLCAAPLEELGGALSSQTGELGIEFDSLSSEERTVRVLGCDTPHLSPTMPSRRGIRAHCARVVQHLAKASCTLDTPPKRNRHILRCYPWDDHWLCLVQTGSRDGKQALISICKCVACLAHPVTRALSYCLVWEGFARKHDVGLGCLEYGHAPLVVLEVSAHASYRSHILLVS